MPQLTQMELNTLKELIATEDVHAKKFDLYAHNCNDPQLQSFFSQQSQNGFSNVRTLMSYLNQ